VERLWLWERCALGTLHFGNAFGFGNAALWERLWLWERCALGTLAYGFAFGTVAALAFDFEV